MNTNVYGIQLTWEAREQRCVCAAVRNSIKLKLRIETYWEEVYILKELRVDLDV
jgi:hypothetical protein